jgi:hypothetical protein
LCKTIFDLLATPVLIAWGYTGPPKIKEEFFEGAGLRKL